MVGVGKIGTLAPLPLPHRAPRFPLVPPRTMARGTGQHTARRVAHPGLPLFPLVPLHLIEHDRHRGDRRGTLAIPMCQKRAECPLPFPRGGGGIDLPGPRVTTCQPMQGPLALLLVFDADGPARLRRPGRGLAGTWRPAGFLVDAHHHVPYSQRTRVQRDTRLDLGRQGRLPRALGRPPQRRAPGVQLVGRQHPRDGLGRNGGHDAGAAPLARQFRALPRRQRTPGPRRTLAGQLDHRPRPCRGENTGGRPGRFLSDNPSIPGATKRRAHLRPCRSWRSTCLAGAAKEEPSANSHRARARWASPTGVCCVRSPPVKGARVSSGISIWMAAWRPCISCPLAMWCKRHETSAIPLPIFPSLFHGDLYLARKSVVSLAVFLPCKLLFDKTLCRTVGFWCARRSLARWERRL